MKQEYLDLLREAEASNEYWTETAIADFTEELCRLMESKGISRSQLAAKIGHSPAYITKALRGNVNFTLATMTEFARALDAVVRIHLAPSDTVVEWKDSVPTTIDYKVREALRAAGYLEDVE